MRRSSSRASGPGKESREQLNSRQSSSTRNGAAPLVPDRDESRRKPLDSELNRRARSGAARLPRGRGERARELLDSGRTCASAARRERRANAGLRRDQKRIRVVSGSVA